MTGQMESVVLFLERKRVIAITVIGNLNLLYAIRLNSLPCEQ